MTALPSWPANWLADAAPALLSFGFLLLIEFIHNQSVGDVVFIDVLVCGNHFVKISEALLTGTKNLFGSINTLCFHCSHKMDLYCKQNYKQSSLIKFLFS